MTGRIMLAFAASLLTVAPALAQTSATPPSVPPAGVNGSTPPASTPTPVAVDGPPSAAPWFGPTDGLAPGGRERFWVTADYTLNWFRGDRPPPLVTTSPADTPRDAAGVLGSTATTTLFGGEPVNENLRSGIRLASGYWFESDRTLGVEAGFWITEAHSTVFSAASDGSSILARPFFDATTGAPQANLLAFPGLSSGNIDARVASGNLYDWYIDLTENVFDNGVFRLDTLVGFRFLFYDDSLRVRASLSPIDGAFVPGTQIVTLDEFRARNTFGGVDLGLRGGVRWENLTAELLAKVAAGRWSGRVDINGSQTVSVPGTETVVNPGGFLALSSNSGRHSGHDWNANPELDFNVGWQVNPNIRLRVGYSVLFLDGILRGSNQVDLTINPNLLPPANPGATPNSPVFRANRTDMWVQSFNLGVEFRY